MPSGLDRKAKLFIATPMYGGQCAGLYADSMCRLYRFAAMAGLSIEHKFVYGASLIPVIRTVLANDFIKTDATHLLFVDADIGFKPEYVLELLKLQQSEGYDVIGGAYLQKAISWKRVVGALRSGALLSMEELNYCTGNFGVKLLKEEAGYDPDSKMPLEVSHLGSGFTLIPRETFFLFKEKFPERAYRGGEVAYFTSEVQGGQYISEDAFFCRMVRQAGGRVWFCPWMRLAHVGTHVYGWNPTKLEE